MPDGPAFEAGVPVFRPLKGEAFDWVLKVWQQHPTLMRAAWISSSRRTVKPKTPSLKSVKDGAPQVQNLNLEWTYGSSVRSWRVDDLSGIRRVGRPRERVGEAKRALEDCLEDFLEGLHYVAIPFSDKVERIHLHGVPALFSRTCNHAS
jgi:hypothetical protein